MFPHARLYYKLLGIMNLFGQWYMENPSDYDSLSVSPNVAKICARISSATCTSQTCIKKQYF